MADSELELPGWCMMLKDLLAEIEGEKDNDGAAKEERNTSRSAVDSGSFRRP